MCRLTALSLFFFGLTWGLPSLAGLERPSGVCQPIFTALIHRFGTDLEPIARGGGAFVFLNRNTPTPTAIKVPLGEELQNRSALQHEAVVLGQIAEVDTTGLFVRGHLEKDHMLVMNTLLFDGHKPRTITDILKAKEKANFNPDQIAEQLWQAHAVLQQAGEVGWVHSDLHPGNILIDSTGKILIIDLGLAAPVGGYASYLGKVRLGTAPYAPYEQHTLNRPAHPSNDERPIKMIIEHFHPRP